MNNSSTGGYILPTTTQGPPGGLTLTQFIQTVFVGLTGLDGKLVKPKWQVAPPKAPDIDVDWLAFGITTNTPDANGYVSMKPDESTEYKRNENLEITCSFYGPSAMDYVGLIRDGFQIPQNREALTRANMGFTSVGSALHIPELISGRYFNRYEMSVFLVRQVQRTYPILSFLSAGGSINAPINGNDNYQIDFLVEET